MKKIAAALAILSLSGCAYLSDIWHPVRYDSGEYGGLVNIRQTLSRFDMCDNDQKVLAGMLQQEVKWEKTYVSLLPHNTEVNKMLDLLQPEVDNFVEKSKNPNPVYCKFKLSVLDDQVKIIQETVGKQ